MEIVRKIRHPVIILTIVFAILLMLGAGTHQLSGDEPDTALFARNIVKFGVPTAWDGTNLAITNLVVGGDFLNHVHPWFPYYLVAVFFRLFGESVWSARIPFILFSIASIPIFYHLALSITKKKEVSLFATTSLVLSVPFILYSYQARYYAIVILAGLLMTVSSLCLVEKTWAKIGFVVGSVIFFHSNYAPFAVFWLSLLVVGLVRGERRERGRFLLWYIGLSLIVALFTAPWFLAFRPDQMSMFSNPEQVKTISLYIGRYLTALSVYSRNGAFPVTFFFLLVFVFVLRFFQKRPVSDLLFPAGLAFLFLFFMSVLAVTLKIDVDLTENRYTVVIFPYLVLTSVTLITDIAMYGKRVVVIVSLLYLFTNVLSLERPRIFLLEFAGEIIHPYDTADHVVAQYLLAHAKPGDTVLAAMGYPFGLLYFIGDRLTLVNYVGREDHRFDRLPQYLRETERPPDWVVRYGTREPFANRNVPPGNLETDYEKIIMPVSIIEPSGRPEIDMHAFSLPIVREEDRIVLYKRKT